MKPLQKTLGTQTREGFIRHLEMFGSYGAFLAPVKLDFSKPITTGAKFYPPLKRGKKLVYALPGGGEIVA